jgi:hypothetical protein
MSTPLSHASVPLSHGQRDLSSRHRLKKVSVVPTVFLEWHHKPWNGKFGRKSFIQSYNKEIQAPVFHFQLWSRSCNRQLSRWSTSCTWLLRVPSGSRVILFAIVVQTGQERDRRLPVASDSSLDLPLIKWGVARSWEPPCATDTLFYRKFYHQQRGDLWVSRFSWSSREGNSSDSCIQLEVSYHLLLSSDSSSFSNKNTSLYLSITLLLAKHTFIAASSNHQPP